MLSRMLCSIMQELWFCHYDGKRCNYKYNITVILDSMLDIIRYLSLIGKWAGHACIRSYTMSGIMLINFHI